MRKRKYDALLKRAEAFGEAVSNASARLRDVRSPLVVQVGQPDFQFVPYGAGIGVQLALGVAVLPSWRVGSNEHDKFFELKLIPEIEGLVLPMPRADGTTSAEVFVEVPLLRLFEVYSAREIWQLIRILNKIQPFKSTRPDDDSPDG